ncbi:hypothetical protein IscW_ISCW022023 [Ixodes scapularis]|uniref:Uncharacterized protein n=1 Tax=Ixodes scapularis TaxID=6945 RepID=B7QFN0_IXOSC|nr:hypothetical protein IscW_ISCW022023 [Ixodes scapularis]|eukprot:XP_002414344.1 hypothetical protein IscW_ISCW022023 [Ixodes scapularis]
MPVLWARSHHKNQRGSFSSGVQRGVCRGTAALPDWPMRPLPQRILQNQRHGILPPVPAGQDNSKLWIDQHRPVLPRGVSRGPLPQRHERAVHAMPKGQLPGRGAAGPGVQGMPHRHHHGRRGLHKPQPMLRPLPGQRGAQGLRGARLLRLRRGEAGPRMPLHASLQAQQRLGRVCRCL